MKKKPPYVGEPSIKKSPARARCRKLERQRNALAFGKPWHREVLIAKKEGERIVCEIGSK